MFGLSSAASAQEIVTWGTVGGWVVLVDKTLNNGCFIKAEFEDDSLIRMGIDKEASGGYVTAFNYNWGDIAAGARYDITFNLDGELYEGAAEGIYLAGSTGVDITFDNDEFCWDLMSKNVMTLVHDGREVMSISLEGTFVGLEALLECQAEVDSVR